MLISLQDLAGVPAGEERAGRGEEEAVEVAGGGQGGQGEVAAGRRGAGQRDHLQPGLPEAPGYQEDGRLALERAAPLPGLAALGPLPARPRQPARLALHAADCARRQLARADRAPVQGRRRLAVPGQVVPATRSCTE